MQANVSELLVEASTLMIVGMCVVFVFLSLMIGAVNLIAFINSKLPEEALPIHGSASRKSVKSASETSVPVAAIAAAVHQYRKNR